MVKRRMVRDTEWGFAEEVPTPPLELREFARQPEASPYEMFDVYRDEHGGSIPAAVIKGGVINTVLVG